MKKLIVSILILITLALPLSSCQPKDEILKGPAFVELDMGAFGKIVLELDPESAPKTATNFVKLVKSGFYDGLTFHRVMSDFMIQGGQSSKKAKTIKGEFASNGFTQNTISHTRGTISMARSNDPDSASCQFFICNADATFLDGNYAAFGRVVEGMEVVDLITEITEPYANPYNNNVISEASNRAVIRKARVLSDYTPPAENEKAEEPFVETNPIYAEMKIAGHGTMIIELCPTAAPKTVENFVKLVSEGFYDGLTFHRVMSNFMIQGGDPDANGTGGSGTNIVGEFILNNYKNPIKHERGVLSMARSNDPNSASSQFFIMHKEAKHLNGSYAAFGRVISGIEVVDSVVETTAGYGNSNGQITDKNLQATIEYVRILENYTPAE